MLISVDTGDQEGIDVRSGDKSYYALKLNDLSDRSWAVVGRPSGAIALGNDDKLLMRMTKDEAERMVQLMSDPLDNDPSSDTTDNHA